MFLKAVHAKYTREQKSYNELIDARVYLAPQIQQLNTNSFIKWWSESDERNIYKIIVKVAQGGKNRRKY